MGPAMPGPGAGPIGAAAAPPERLIVLRGVSEDFGALQVLRNIDPTIRPGKAVALIGRRRYDQVGGHP
ncbi:hypothetical protein GCM10010442_67840 [Kitasatospora kifunensis]